MTTSILDAERLSLSQAAQRLNVHVATVWRWAMHGVKGRKLPSFEVGGRRYVLVSDLEHFVEEGRSAEQRPSYSRRAAEAGRELDAAGI